jgi:hypothetical protein
MAVWSGSTAPSGAPIYQKFNQTPNYIDSINGFYTYLTGPVYLPAGTYFFGTIQNAATILNLGLDINTPADQSKKLINTTGNWTNSQLPGMWMIRPVLSSTPIDVGIHSPGTVSPSLSIYPVPASQEIHIRANITDPQSVTMEVLDMTGRTVFKRDGFSETLNIGFLEYGTYFLRISDSSRGTMVTSRFIKAE